ncbi:MAG: Protein-export protein SecB [Pseudomonadota bacterium]
MSEASTPVFQIQRVYMKEASLEQPNSPGILLEQQQPAVDIQLGVEANQAAEGVYEICVTATVHTKIEDKTVFLVECKQAGIFEIRNLPRQRGRLGDPCRLSSSALGRNKFPSHVRATAS